MRIKTLLLMLLTAVVVNAQTPKREFRGAWIQCVNGQFQGLGTERMQATLTKQLDELQRCKINAIIFQVRPEFDALYPSNFEPWSRFLTGTQGTPPSPYWDPLQWMIDECHKRGMELHAWLNPYRAKTKGTNALAVTHAYQQHPERFFWYDDMIIADPGQEVNRKYFCAIVQDIVKRYDVDGIHIDDYFYPYPANGQPIPDEQTYQMYNRGINNIGDWRRDNVNLLIKEINQVVKQTKPWVKFGVSPFGIYRNQKSWKNGSATNGLQNYDDLYADVLKWVDEEWVDYNIPQLYWEIGHKAADYETLINWWSKHAGKRPVFVGQDVMRTVQAKDLNNPQTHQMMAKYNLQRSLSGIEGSCQWPASSVADNAGGYADMLKKEYHRYPALQPLMPYIDHQAPGKVKKLKPIWMGHDYMLFWTAPKAKHPMDEAVKYVVYRFPKGIRVNIDDPSYIVAITTDTFYKLPVNRGKEKYTYVVTALDRLSNESRPVKKSVKL